ncbi:MAG: hypothetical protein U0519_01880 [Candidatus Gracilibacteria bacterium]
MLKKTLFNKVMYKGIIGAIIGIVSGLLMGLLIWGLELVVMMIKINLFNRPFMAYQDFPVEIITLFSMGFGALVGSTGGVWATFAEEKKGLKK